MRLRFCRDECGRWSWRERERESCNSQVLLSSLNRDGDALLVLLGWCWWTLLGLIWFTCAVLDFTLWYQFRKPEQNRSKSDALLVWRTDHFSQEAESCSQYQLGHDFSPNCHFKMSRFRSLEETLWEGNQNNWVILTSASRPVGVCVIWAWCHTFRCLS